MSAGLTLELLDLDTVVACLRCGMLVRRARPDAGGCRECGTNVVGEATLEVAQLESFAEKLKALCGQPEGGCRIRLQIAAEPA